jgi:dihydrofolate synthase/folylpolyglutamate synthase
MSSPHLERINERIRIDGENISDENFAAIWTRIHATIERLMASGKLAGHPTFFECVTAIAFVAFADHKVDFSIYEVGMGGRFDATNIVHPEIGVITPIDFDHENFLGHSIEEIAGEKAGIIKPGMWVVSSVTRPEALQVVAKQCQEVNAKLFNVDELWSSDRVESRVGLYRASITSRPTKHNSPSTSLVLAPSLPGEFQIRNALAAATAAQRLADRGVAITNENIERGIAAARWPGRLEHLSERPDVYLDGTHNPAGARELVRFWKDNFKNRRIFLVYGAMRDKAVDEIAGQLFPCAETVIVTAPRQPRAISASLLGEMTLHFAKNAIVIPDASDALEAALQMASPEDAVFATGSLFLVGELRSYWQQRTTASRSAIFEHRSR